jgi:hypothetical protein
LEVRIKKAAQDRPALETQDLAVLLPDDLFTPTDLRIKIEWVIELGDTKFNQRSAGGEWPAFTWL